METSSKYTKIPVEIEAIQYTGTNKKAIEAFVGKKLRDHHSSEQIFKGESGFKGLFIPTLEGIMLASATDYIIKGVEGEFYPCKESIFNKTYIKAE